MTNTTQTSFTSMQTSFREIANGMGGNGSWSQCVFFNKKDEVQKQSKKGALHEVKMLWGHHAI